MGRVDNIFQSKLNQVNEMMKSHMSRAGISSSGFSAVLNQATQQTELAQAAERSAQQQSTISSLPNEYRYENIINEMSEKYDLDPNLIRAVMRNESRFKRNALSSSGAMGLMQLMPGTASDMGVTDAFDPYQNIKGGSRYLRMQIDRFGDVRMALAAYNTGPNRVSSYGITDPDDEKQYNRINEQARNYVDNVMKYYTHYTLKG